MQIPILNGIYTDEASNFRTSYPRNLIPVPKENGISNGYLRPSYGLEAFGTGPGVDRGGVEWDGVLYRVMGTKLVSVASDGTVTELGDVGNGGTCTLVYSFDRLAITSGGRLYYWNGVTLTQVTDPDLGTALDVIWVDGYFMTTDGEFLVVTELTDPTQVDPTKYGSSEADPDPVKALLKLRNEAYAANRYTIEVFENVGGVGFPFQRIEGAQMTRGTVGTYANCVFLEAIAFVGSGRGEAPAVWIGSGGRTQKLSTREIDQILQDLPESTLAQVVLEPVVEKSHQWLYMHLPNQTWVYDGAASQVLGDPVWFSLDSGLVNPSQYRFKHLIWCYNQWIAGDPTSNTLATYSDAVSSHYGDVIGWDFGTKIVYNNSRGAVMHEMELVALPGRVPFGQEGTVWTSYSTDGETFSQEKAKSTGASGQRNKRIVWYQQGFMRNWRIQKFRGTSESHMSIARLEAQIEPLNA